MPDITFPTKEDIPESLREHAKEKDGKYVVGVVHEGFRDKNIALLQERDGLKTRVEAYSKIVGDDVDGFGNELVELRNTAQLVKDGKLTKKDDIEREIASRLSAKEGGFQEQLKAAATETAAQKTRADTYEGKYKGLVVDQAIISAVTAADSGANPQALPDILNRARGVFSAKEDGTLIAKKGDTIWYGADGESSISPKEWVAALLKDAPYLGNPSNGAGGAGNKQVHGAGDASFNNLPPAERIAKFRAANGGR